MFELFNNVMINLMRKENEDTLDFLDSLYKDNCVEDEEEEGFWESLEGIFKNPFYISEFWKDFEIKI